MKTLDFTKNEIKNFLVNRSFLHKKAKSSEEVLRHFKCIQVDPINVVSRSHELALWNRIEDFSKEQFYFEMYVGRKYFEYWMQLYSIIPIDYFPYLSARMNIKKSWQVDFYKKHKKQINQTLEFMEKSGPISSKEMTHIKNVGTLFSWTGGNSRTALLQYLWDVGKVLVNHRTGNRKYYELAEKVLEEKHIKHNISEIESIRFIIKSNFDYLGVFKKSFLSRVGYDRNSLLNSEFNKMLDEEKIFAITIDGKKTKYFILADHLKEIEKLKTKNLHKGLNILPPLDPLVIDRDLLELVFDFRYRWEAYVPKVKRNFGYYGMPILYKGNFVGQIDLIKNKTKKSLDILNLDISTGDIELKKMLGKEIIKLNEFAQT